MRKNLPITNRNFNYSRELTLISVTDLKGRITYCNEDFIQVSGFSRAELLGQPHNILRHPDVPAEAFRDFWDTIQNGKLWSAVLKNRRKNGDTYWVRANATPMRDGDKIVGYLSVRTLPTDQEINDTQALFTTMQSEAEKGKLKHKFRHGKLIQTGVFVRIKQFCTLGIKTKIFLLTLLAILAPVIATYLGVGVEILAFTVAIAALVATCGICRLLFKPLNQVINTTTHLASGDLSDFVNVNQKGFIADLLLPIAQLALAIRTVMVDVRNDLRNLSASSQALHSSSDLLQQRTQNQAKNIKSVQNISTSIEETSNMTEQVVNIVDQANNAVYRSQEAVQSVSQTMDSISESSRSIGDFIEVIEGVAFQTNILALNAAVEAARAGESGRGFAVVASEVRVLAQRTSSAAREIKLLIEESHNRIASGNSRTDEARQRMQDVVESVKQVSSMIHNINVATQQQSTIVDQVNNSILELENITEQNSDLVCDLAQESVNMRNEILNAINNIRVFRLSKNEKTHAETDAVQLRRDNKMLVKF